MMVINLARRCREIDRQYEFNNNGELDNGVYHKFVYNSDEDIDKEAQPEDKDGINLEPMLLSASFDKGDLKLTQEISKRRN
jgi:hypothetical protein